MNRHPVRWGSLAFGLFFLAAIGQWAVWKQDVLTPRELSLTAASVLIVLGVLGVAATLWHARPTTNRSTTNRSTDRTSDETTDPLP